MIRGYAFAERRIDKGLLFVVPPSGVLDLGTYPKEKKLQSKHGESLKSRSLYSCFMCHFFALFLFNMSQGKCLSTHRYYQKENVSKITEEVPPLLQLGLCHDAGH